MCTVQDFLNMAAGWVKASWPAAVGADKSLGLKNQMAENQFGT